MNQHFPNLFSPLQVGSHTLKNRLVCTGHATVFEDGGKFSERHLYYYRERAKGGVGMIITEAASIHPTGLAPLKMFDKAVIPMLRQIADAVHEYDVPILVQATHAGRRAPNPNGVLETVAVAPSAIPAPSLHFGQMMPHEMSAEEVEELVRAFGESSANVHDAGLDGIELSVAFGNLVPQFLSEASNVRTDRYGGSFEKRMTFLYEVIDAIRDNIGDQSILGVRLTEDFLDYGLDIDDLKKISRLLEATGKIDYLSITAGTNYDLDSAASIIPSHYFEPGQFAGLAAQIKEQVSLPVIGAGRMNAPALAEGYLKSGQFDLVGMARELIADPYLPQKAQEGRASEIRPCIACNQSCKGHQAVGLPITCIYNPIAGREKEWAEMPLADVSKKVIVVGGGPAGMEAARVAASRGHQVTLIEKSDRLGGQINIATNAPDRDEFGKIARFLEGQLKDLGVNIRLESEATSTSILNENPDAVVIATGSTPFTPAIPGAESGQVTTARDALEGNTPVGEKVVLIDTQGLRAGCDAANFLASQGKDVEIVTGMPYVGQHVQVGVWRHLYEDLLRKGVKMSPLTGVTEIGENTVSTFNSVYQDSSMERIIEGVDTIVFASGGQANDNLFQELSGEVQELYAIGDCLQPRDVEAAIYEGHKIGRAI